ncbi:protein of unknown function [Hyphomicrobium sp. MC1]|nr:protein of unknown function [Hyphomicrobium sp. MC1]
MGGPIRSVMPTEVGTQTRVSKGGALT